MCVYGGSAVPQGELGDRHLVTVPQGVVGDRLPWGGEGQGGGRAGLCLKGRGRSGQFRSGRRAVTRDVKAVGGRLLAVGIAVGGWRWGTRMPLG